jgi:arylsulfatase A-like enzyme
MVMAWKGRLGKGIRVKTPVSANDIFPTLTELLGVDAGPVGSMHGRSVASLLGGGVTGESFRVAETYIPKHLITAWKYNHPFQDPPDLIRQRWQAVWEGDLKYIRIQDGEGGLVDEMLFDLGADPQEAEDLKEERAGDLERLRAILDAWQQDMTSDAGDHGSDVPPLDEETRERLHHLGYIGSED